MLQSLLIAAEAARQTSRRLWRGMPRTLHVSRAYSFRPIINEPPNLFFISWFIIFRFHLLSFILVQWQKFEVILLSLLDWRLLMEGQLPRKTGRHKGTKRDER